LFLLVFFNGYCDDPSLEEKLKDHIHFSQDQPNTVGLIKIDDRTSGISEATWLYVKKSLEYYKKTRPAFIILELNTPGGEVFAAQKISDALKEFDTQEGIPTVAFINNWAISAGAMLAYSTRFITAVKDASMGAAEPILMGNTGETKEASEKVNSAIRSDFASRARFYDRNPYIAEGMVDKDIILVQRDGKVIKLNNENEIRTKDPDPDIIVKNKGKLLTFNAEDLLKYNVANLLLLPKKLEPITPEEQEKGQWPARKTLLFQEPFFKTIPNAAIDAYQMDWKTRFFVFLANPIVTSILMLGLMAGIYLEMSFPGATLPATIGFICLFLIVISNLSLQIAGWLEVILLITGLAVLIFDLTILPTFGLLGIIGAILFLAGLAGMMIPGIGSVNFDIDTQSLNAAGIAVLERLAWFSATILLGIVLIMILARFFTPKMTAWSRFVLSGHEQDASQGYIAGVDTAHLPQVGSKGKVMATLRPAGKVVINNVIYDAISPGNFIDKGEDIVVAQLNGSVIIVNKAK